MTVPARVDKGSVLFVASTASFLTPFMGSSVNVALPVMGTEFGMDALMLNWVALAFMLTAAMFLVPFGRLADIHGRKRVFQYGMSIYTFSSLLLALSTSGIVVVAFRGIQGLGSAMIFGTSVAIITSTFPPGERGRALGIAVAAVYAGLSLGPSLGGVLVHNLGWRSIFLLNVPLGMLVIALTVLRLRGEWVGAKGERFDHAGAVMYSLSLLGMMYGFSLLPGMVGLELMLVGGTGLLIFIFWEVSTPSPVFNVNVFRGNRVFTFSNIAALINYSATFGVGFLLSLYLQYGRGLDPQAAGMVLVVQPVIMALVSPFAGRLSDSISARVIASLGMALSAMGLYILTFLDRSTPLTLVLGSLVLLGFGFGLFSSPNTNAIMSSIGKRFYGIASATVGTMRLVGGTLSMGIVMLMFSLYLGRSQITPAVYPQFLESARTAFLVFALLCSIGVAASLVRGGTPPVAGTGRS